MTTLFQSANVDGEVPSLSTIFPDFSPPLPTTSVSPHYCGVFSHFGSESVSTSTLDRGARGGCYCSKRRLDGADKDYRGASPLRKQKTRKTVLARLSVNECLDIVGRSIQDRKKMEKSPPATSSSSSEEDEEENLPTTTTGPYSGMARPRARLRMISQEKNVPQRATEWKRDIMDSNNSDNKHSNPGGKSTVLNGARCGDLPRSWDQNEDNHRVILDSAGRPSVGFKKAPTVVYIREEVNSIDANSDRDSNAFLSPIQEPYLPYCQDQQHQTNHTQPRQKSSASSMCGTTATTNAAATSLSSPLPVHAKRPPLQSSCLPYHSIGSKNVLDSDARECNYATGPAAPKGQSSGSAQITQAKKRGSGSDSNTDNGSGDSPEEMTEDGDGTVLEEDERRRRYRLGKMASSQRESSPPHYDASFFYSSSRVHAMERSRSPSLESSIAGVGRSNGCSEEEEGGGGGENHQEEEDAGSTMLLNSGILQEVPCAAIAHPHKDLSSHQSPAAQSAAKRESAKMDANRTSEKKDEQKVNGVPLRPREDATLETNPHEENHEKSKEGVREEEGLMVIVEKTTLEVEAIKDQCDGAVLLETCGTSPSPEARLHYTVEAAAVVTASSPPPITTIPLKSTRGDAEQDKKRGDEGEKQGSRKATKKMKKAKEGEARKNGIRPTYAACLCGRRCLSKPPKQLRSPSSRRLTGGDAWIANGGLTLAESEHLRREAAHLARLLREKDREHHQRSQRLEAMITARVEEACEKLRALHESRRQELVRTLADTRAELAETSQQMELSTGRSEYRTRAALALQDAVHKAEQEKVELFWRERLRLAELQEQCRDEQRIIEHEVLVQGMEERNSTIETLRRSLQKIAAEHQELSMTCRKQAQEIRLLRFEKSNRDAQTKPIITSSPQWWSGARIRGGTAAATAGLSSVIHRVEDGEEDEETYTCEELRRIIEEMGNHQAALLSRLDEKDTQISQLKAQQQEDIEALQRDLQSERARSGDLVMLYSEQVQSLHSQLAESLAQKKEYQEKLALLRSQIH